MKYIDADKLKAEIERRKNYISVTHFAEELLSFLEKQKEHNPELVQHPPITYMYPSDASRDEQLKRAILALLNSDLIKVAGNKFTKQDLIDWVEKQNIAEWSEEDEEMLEYVIGDVNDAKQLFATKEAIYLCDKEIAWLKSLRPQKK